MEYAEIKVLEHIRSSTLAEIYEILENMQCIQIEEQHYLLEIFEP